MAGFIDFTASALDGNEENAKATQEALIALGFDLGAAGADGDLGARSRAAITEWKTINGYDDVAGDDISVAQFAALRHQGAYPEVFEYQRAAYNQNLQQDFYQNFDQSLLSHMDPVRAAVVMQMAAHLGATEDRNPGEEFGNNRGAAVEQYVQGVKNASVGNAWCAAFGTWAIDQLENYAGLEKSEFMDGDAGVKRLFDKIEATQPQAVGGADYVAQPGDAVMIVRDDGTGHHTTAIHSVDLGDGYTGVYVIDGNSGDSVSLSEIAYYTDPDSGTRYRAAMDAEGFLYPLMDEEVEIVDISALPNYDRMTSAFNNNAVPFVPTPSADPDFQLNLDALAGLQGILAEQQSLQAPPPALAQGIPEFGREFVGTEPPATTVSTAPRLPSF